VFIASGITPSGDRERHKDETTGGHHKEIQNNERFATGISCQSYIQAPKFIAHNGDLAKFTQHQ
jgi:hypothetical protein